MACTAKTAATGAILRDFVENHFRKLLIVDFPVVVGVCFRYHLLYFLVAELLAEMHHAVLELLLADVTVTVPIEHPKSKKGEKLLIRSCGRIHRHFKWT